MEHLSQYAGLIELVHELSRNSMDCGICGRRTGGLGPVVGDFIVAQQTEASEISASFVRDAMEREKASRQVRGLPLD